MEYNKDLSYKEAEKIIENNKETSEVIVTPENIDENEDVEPENQENL